MAGNLPQLAINDFPCQRFSARLVHPYSNMCGWLMAIYFSSMAHPKPKSKAVHTTHSFLLSDFSGTPLSKRRAYGRIISTPFYCQEATIKRLKPIQTKTASRQVSNDIQLFALTLKSGDGDSSIVYFTRESNQLAERFEYRHRPYQTRKTGSIPIGITSVQFIAPNPKTGNRESHVYIEAFSTRLFIGSTHNNQVSGSLVVVFPDSKRSFVSGSFKARLVGFDNP